jgi:uncharacterized protein with HEPN domain
MSPEQDHDRLSHMLEAAREAVGYAQDRTREDLETDRTLMHSLVHCLEIVGEAASQVSPGVREASPQIPWGDIVGMRNRLIHGYFDVNLDVVWKTVKEELPPLIDRISLLLADVNSR